MVAIAVRLLSFGFAGNSQNQVTEYSQGITVPSQSLPIVGSPPVILLAFDRPELLVQVAESLAAQQPALDPARVHLFLDGAYCPHRNAAVTDPALLDRAVMIFRRVFPAGQVHRAPQNLGVAFNFDRAERFAFQTLGAEVAYFLEDDLVLSPHYLATLDRLAALALLDERIAYVAAYGNHRLDVAAQQARQTELQPMEHLWGYALTRRHWQERQPLWQPYLALLRGQNYRDRPHQAVLEHWWHQGVGVTVSSQDGGKVACCQLLDRLRLSTVAVLGRNIGEYGLHFTPEAYCDAGYHLTQMLPAEAPLGGMVLPDAAGMAALLAEDRAVARTLPGVPPALRRSWPAQTLPLDAAGLVTLLYRTLLGREPDSTGLAAYSQRLEQGEIDTAQLVVGFMDSREFKAMLGSVGLHPPPA
jgi:hypothetical protein